MSGAVRRGTESAESRSLAEYVVSNRPQGGGCVEDQHQTLEEPVT